MNRSSIPRIARVGPVAGLLIALACAARVVLPTLSDRPISRADGMAAEAAYEQGLALVQAGAHPAALAEFTRVVEQYPSSQYSGMALYWQGRTLYQMGNDSAAALSLQRYVGLSPQVPEREHAILILANSLYGLARYDAALSAGLEIERSSPARLSEFLDLSRDLVDHLPRSTIENAARAEPARNWLSPVYLQAARWAHADGEAERARALAERVISFSELPPVLLAEARTLAGTGGAAARPRLGFLAPSESRFADVSKEIRRGIELALADLNRGRALPYEVVSRSIPNEPDSTLNVIRELSRGERVQAILGPLTSELAHTAGEAAIEEGVVLVSPTATDARLLEIGDRVYTVNALDGAIGHTIGTYAVQGLKRKRFAILAVDNVYGEVQANAFAQAVQNGGARVVYRHVYEPTSTQFTDRLGEIVRAGADAVFIATQSPTEALRILNQIAFFELGGLMPLGTDAWNDEEFYRQGQRFVRGYFADTFSRDPRVTRWETFAADYATRYGAEPVNLIPAWGYDAARLALEWMSGSQRTAPSSAVGTPSDRAYRGASALFRFGSQGPRRAVVVHRIEGGQPVAVDW